MFFLLALWNLPIIARALIYISHSILTTPVCTLLINIRCFFQFLFYWQRWKNSHHFLAVFPLSLWCGSHIRNIILTPSPNQPPHIRLPHCVWTHYYCFYTFFIPKDIFYDVGAGISAELVLSVKSTMLEGQGQSHAVSGSSGIRLKANRSTCSQEWSNWNEFLLPVFWCIWCQERFVSEEWKKRRFTRW